MTKAHGSGGRPAHTPGGDDLADLEEQFGECDLDGDQRITSAEFEQLLDNLGSELGPAQRRAQFAAIDVDRDGIIDRGEFMGWWARR